MATMSHPNDLKDAARQMRVQGLLLREIGAELGVSRATVSAWLDPQSADKQKRRRERYRGTCVDCGNPTDGSNGRKHAPKRCATCAAKHQSDNRHWTRETILAAFQRYYAEYGDQPSAAEILRLRPGHWFPSVGTVKREFGSWSAAIEAAGWRPWAKLPTPTGGEMHDYIILRQNGDGGFHTAGEVEAPTRESALRKFLAAQPENEREGVYATVPLSNWNPRRVRLKMQPTLEFDAA